MERALERLDKQTDTTKRSRTDGTKSADPGTSSSAAASSLEGKRGRWQAREAPPASAAEELRREIGEGLGPVPK